MDSEDWALIRDLAKQTHKERVAETPNRVKYAEQKFKENGFQFKLKNTSIGHFHVFDKDGNLFQFWASTGKIYYDKKTKDAKGFDKNSSEFRGIDKLIKLMNEEKKYAGPITNVFCGETKIGETDSFPASLYTKEYVEQTLEKVRVQIQLAAALQNDNEKVTLSAVENIIDTIMSEVRR